MNILQAYFSHFNISIQINYTLQTQVPCQYKNLQIILNMSIKPGKDVFFNLLFPIMPSYSKKTFIRLAFDEHCILEITCLEQALNIENAKHNHQCNSMTV